MMENYEQEDYSRQMKGIIMMDAAGRVHDVQIESKQSDFIAATTAELCQSAEHKQNFNFGAEIVKARQHQHQHEHQHQQQQEHELIETASKTNIITKTKAKALRTETKVSTTPATTTTINIGNEIPSPSHALDDSTNARSNVHDDDDGDDDDNATREEEEETSNTSSQPEAAHSGLADADDDDSDDSGSDSDYSDTSGLSDMSGREWKPASARPINWVQKQIMSGANPRELLTHMLPTSANQISSGLNDVTLWRILASLISEPPRRQKLRYVNTFDDVIQLIQRSKNIIVLTGAGVSVSCGIPDFRSSDGIYSRLAKDYPDLPDPQAMFDIGYFSRDPRPFFKFAREIYPGQFRPSPCHRFIKLLEEKQKLLRNYTQNIDTLEQVAGIRNVIECHGSFSSASCTKCRYKCDADAIRADIFAQRIPACPRCQPNVQQSVDASQPVAEMELKRLVENGIMKPDIVFFGEGLPQEFHTVMASDKDKCDLLIVMGSSLKVRPVALIPSSIPADVPQILINREQLHHLEFDVELLGDSDVIINQLCHRLGEDWQEICCDGTVLKEANELMQFDDANDGDGEEDVPNALDTDTQSVKSNASTDIALRSAGAYSDSGFESSTSSGMAAKLSGNYPHQHNHHHHHHHLHNHNNHNDTHKTIEQLKSEMLQPLTKNKTAELLPPDLLDEPMEEAVDFGHPDFHGFTKRLAERNGNDDDTATMPSCSESYRHLSIDSTKDSGIQCCDSSNSAMPLSGIGSASMLIPATTSFSDSGGGGSTDEATTAPPHSNAIASSTGADDRESKTLPTSSELKRRRQQKSQSAADFLVEGTYYWHENTSSYIFPGAQVSWCVDDDDDLDNDGDLNNLHDDKGDEDFDVNDDVGNMGHASPLSPLMPPSVEAEMVKEITTTANVFTSVAMSATTATAATSLFVSQNDNSIGGGSSGGTINVSLKRHSTQTIETEENDGAQLLLADDEATVTLNSSSSNKDDSAAALQLCTPPPIKRRRDSGDSPNHSKCSIDTDTATTLPAISSNSRSTISCATESTACNKIDTIKSTSPALTLASLATASVAASTSALDSTSSNSDSSSIANSNRSNINNNHNNNNSCSNSNSSRSGSLNISSPPAEALLQ